MMGRPWDEAVRNGLENAVSLADEATLTMKIAMVMDVLAEEQADLWADLNERRADAIRNRWSMGCDWVTQRIVRLARLTGQPTPWEQIQAELLVDGVYQGILRAAGIPFEEPDMDQVRLLIAARERRQ